MEFFNIDLGTLLGAQIQRAAGGRGKAAACAEAAQAAPTAASTISRSAFWCCAAGKGSGKIAKLHEISLWSAADAAHLLRQPGKLESAVMTAKFGETDAAIVTTHMMLQAQALGLSSVWIGSFDPEKVRKYLHCPNIDPSAILPLGYEAEEGGHGGKRSAGRCRWNIYKQHMELRRKAGIFISSAWNCGEKLEYLQAVHGAAEEKKTEKGKGEEA